MKKQKIIIKYKSTRIRRTEGDNGGGICKLEVEGISSVERSTDLKKILSQHLEKPRSKMLTLLLHDFSGNAKLSLREQLKVIVSVEQETLQIIYMHNFNKNKNERGKAPGEKY